MELKVKENINKESKLLHHKIGVETVTLLEDKGITLDSEIELYTMVATVDNFVEGSLLEYIGDSEDTFETLIEKEIEPFFDTIIKDYDFKDIYDTICDDVINYMYNKNEERYSLIGMLNQLLDFVNNQNWEDLKFFFTKMADTAKETIINNTDLAAEPEKETPTIVNADLRGANAKMAELITKFQKESEELKIKKENEANKESNV